jgi:hypothetical protein
MSRQFNRWLWQVARSLYCKLPIYTSAPLTSAPLNFGTADFGTADFGTPNFGTSLPLSLTSGRL